MKKKKVSLDIFREAVLPQLQEKIAPDQLQKTIDEQYDIYELDGDKEIVVKYSVTIETNDEDEADEAERIQALVDEGIAKALAKQTKPKARLGNVQSEPTKFMIPAEVKRMRPRNFKAGLVGGLEPDERAFRFGMWALDCMGNHAAGEYCREHGIGSKAQLGNGVMAKLASEGTNTAGGYLVPEEFGTDLIDLKETYGVARRLFQREVMTSDTKTIPRRTGGLSASFIAEASAASESTMTWDQIRLVAKDLMVLTRLTGQVNADSIINWSDKLAFECSYANTLKEDQCAFIGTATSTYGGITGVSQALTNKWTAATAGTYNGITKASSTTLASLALADFESAIGSLPVYAANSNPVWVMHSFVYYSTALRLALAAGGNTAMEIAKGDRAPRPLFLGYPVEFSQVMPSTTAATTVFALLGAFQLGATFGDRQQDSISFSDVASVGSESMWERNEMGVRCIERFDINVHDVGDGTTTGPIVAVATG